MSVFPTLKIKRSTTANVPTLTYGEIALMEGATPVNTGVFYYGTSGGAAIPIGGPGIFAKLASPAFTGSPTAPTVTAGDNTTNIATTGFVTNAITTLSGNSVHSVDINFDDGAQNVLTILGDPVTGSTNGDGVGTMEIGLATQNANNIFGGPPTGGASTPTFRLLAPADIPNLDFTKVSTGVVPAVQGGTGLSAYSVGDLLYANGATSIVNLAGNNTTAREFLLSVGSGGLAQAPSWSALVSGDIPVINAVTQVADVPSGLLKGVGGIFTAATAGTTGSSSGDYLPPFSSEAQNLVLASPSTGAGVPDFRALVSTDIPYLDMSKVNTGILGLAQGGTGTTLAGTGGLNGAGAASFLKQTTAGVAISVAFVLPVDVPSLDQLTGSSGQKVAGSVDMNGNNIINLGTCSNDSDAANKAYVDSARAGLDVKQSVRVGTTVALPAYTATNTTGGTATLTASANGALTLDGVAVASTNRVLIMGETGANQPFNGIYTVTSAGDSGSAWSLTRSSDANSNADVTSGMFTYVSEGTLLSTSGWILSTPNPISLNVTPLTFTQFSGAGTVLSGAGLDKVGNTLNVLGTTGRILVGTDVDIDPGYIGQTSITTLGAISVGTFDFGVI